MKVKKVMYEDKVEEFLKSLTVKLVELGYSQEMVAVQQPGQKFVPGNASVNAAKRKISEEVLELLEALDEDSIEDVLKEVCDVLYVVLHIPVIYDLPLMPAFNRVHKNNMEKIMHGTMDKHGKLIKPFNHPKVNLKDLFDEKKVDREDA